MSKDYVLQLEATIENLRRDNTLLKEQNAKYKQLEEQLGCPLEVYVKLIQDTEIFDVKKRLYYVKDIADVCGSYVVNTIWFNKQGEEIEHSFYLRDYKKLFWLKKDKRE